MDTKIKIPDGAWYFTAYYNINLKMGQKEKGQQNEYIFHSFV